MPPPPESFRDLLLDLDAAALTAFVAAVYDARGWAVERDGDDLLVRAGGERDPLRLVVAPDRPPADADRVVVPTLTADADAADAADARVLDAAALLELVWYAVDDADRARLFRDFFDRDPADFEATTGAGASTVVPESPVGSTGVPSQSSDAPAAATTGDDTADSSPLLRRRLAVAVMVLLVVGGVAVAVAVGPTLVPSSDGGEATDVVVENETGTAAAADARFGSTAGGGSAPSADAGAVTADGPLPPGVTASGIENASALVDAHEAALDNRSYRLSVVAREFVGGTPTAVARERTVVESPTRYRSDVHTIGTFRQEPRAIGTVSAYANGTTRFVRLTPATDADGTIRFTERGGESGTAGGPGWRSVAAADSDPFANRTATHLRAVLDVDDAAIVGSFERDGTTYVWIDLRRRPPGGTDAIDSVLVDEHGLVHEIRHEYAYLPPEASTVRTVVTVRIEPANVTATPPPWL
jgi:hypothetical protein